ncbi:sigma 54-interacting transcriptional regulator, partial [Bordetella hinzii]|nr:sigma 54-interacting transcriptional regulator [Bordetella hinzii]
HDPAMQRLIGQAQRLASKPVNIIVHGETGTGKEMLAKAIHVAGPRRERPFVAVNCAAIPETLIESELFGYVAGTFTGARAKGQRGLILQADGGTLFLDEIGDMPIHLQSRLLRVLSECEVVPLGAQRPTPVDLRVVAASHRDLRQLIAQGTFREDLYYRLSGATLHLPALRDREDRDYLLDLIAGQEARELGVTPCFDGAARQALLGYAWPGNVRQLRNMLRFALAMSDDGNLTLETLPPELFEHVAGGEAGPLLALLHRHRWHVPSVAKELGLARATVYRRMEKLGIAPSSRPQ